MEEVKGSPMAEPDCPCWKDHEDLMRLQTETAGAALTSLFCVTTQMLCPQAKEYLIMLVLYSVAALVATESTDVADVMSRENCDRILEFADRVPAMIRERMATLRIANAENGGRKQ